MKIALVTGGSGEIGRAICIKLASAGYYVLINYNKNREGAALTLNKIEEAGGVAEIVKFDVADKFAVAGFYTSWKKSHDNRFIDVLVNNAGKTADKLMMMMEDCEWESVIDVNLNGFFYVTKHALKDMMKRKQGRIINISSLSGIRGVPMQTNYSAAKAGIIAATKALAQEVGRYNITVNAIAPGYIKTKMTENINENNLKKYIPANRFGVPDDVAGLVEFLVSEKASYINGEVISVSGGLQ